MDIDGATSVAAFAGLRALAGNGDTAALSREHRIVEEGPGVLRVAGGKLSSARAIAAEVVDRVCRHLGVDRESRTTDDPLVGAGVSAASGIGSELGGCDPGYRRTTRTGWAHGTERRRPRWWSLWRRNPG